MSETEFDYKTDSIFGRLLNFLKPSQDSEYATELNDIVYSLKKELFPAETQEGLKRDFERFSIDSKEPKALIFGAGVSCGDPIGLPNWENLLKHALIGHFLAGNIFPDGVSSYGALKNNYGDYFKGIDLYELAQYVENVLTEFKVVDTDYSEKERKEQADAELYNIVEKSLYDGVKTTVDSSSEDFKKHILYRLSEYIKNSNISRVLTYNYDNAFEYVYYKLKKKKCDRSLYPVFIDDQLHEVDECKDLAVYHVHGYVPHFDEDYTKDARVQTALKNSESRSLILSERSYDNMSYSSYKWRNVVQIDTFLRYNCLFFGFSAEDKNFKRIVKLMGRSGDGTVNSAGVKHYIFMTVDKYVENMFGKADITDDKKHSVFGWLKGESDKAPDNIKDSDKLIAGKFLRYILRARRKYLNGFNIMPIWTVAKEVADCFDYMLNK